MILAVYKFLFRIIDNLKAIRNMHMWILMKFLLEGWSMVHGGRISLFVCFVS